MARRYRRRHVSSALRVFFGTFAMRDIIESPDAYSGMLIHTTPDETIRLAFHMKQSSNLEARDVAFLFIDAPEPRPVVVVHFIRIISKDLWYTRCPGCEQRVSRLYTAPEDHNLKCSKCRDYAVKDRDFFQHRKIDITRARADPLEFVKQRTAKIALWNRYKYDPDTPMYIKGESPSFEVTLGILRAAIHLGPSKNCRYPVRLRKTGGANYF
jgi:hypothetical protein